MLHFPFDTHHGSSGIARTEDRCGVASMRRCDMICGSPFFLVRFARARLDLWPVVSPVGCRAIVSSFPRAPHDLKT